MATKEAMAVPMSHARDRLFRATDRLAARTGQSAPIRRDSKEPAPTTKNTSDMEAIALVAEVLADMLDLAEQAGLPAVPPAGSKRKEK